MPLLGGAVPNQTDLSSLDWGWWRRSGRCARSECFARRTRRGGSAGRSSGRDSNGKGCWCSWDAAPPCGYCRWRPAAPPESSGPSSHTQRGTDTSCTCKTRSITRSLTFSLFRVGGHHDGSSVVCRPKPGAPPPLNQPLFR